MSRHTIGFRQTQPRAVKLDELLYAELPARLQAILGDSEVSRSKIRRLIIAGAVAVNGRQARTPSASVSSGSSVSIAIDTERFTF
jgi:ribosomal protein S4